MTINEPNDKESNGDTATGTEPVAEADAAAASEAKPVAHAEEDYDEVPYVPSRPLWENPEVLDLYLTSDDPVEHALVSYLLRMNHELIGPMVESAESDSAALAGKHFRDAVQATKALFAVLGSLDGYRNGRVQNVHVLRTSGIQVGLRNKVEALMKPKLCSPEANLIEFVETLAWRFGETADRFARTARGVDAACGDEAYRLRALHLGLTVATPKEAAQWRALATKALVEQAKVLDRLAKFAKSRRQVTIVEQTDIKPSARKSAKSRAKRAKAKPAISRNDAEHPSLL